MEEECCFTEEVASERLCIFLDLKQVKLPQEDSPHPFSLCLCSPVLKNQGQAQLKIQSAGQFSPLVPKLKGQH